ncbi:MAG: hypothetical protein R6X25_07395 [Candidatus Krumholzibacteriia bacterium]
MGGSRRAGGERPERIAGAAVPTLRRTSRRQAAALWILAVLLTLTSVVWQRLTGPTYPVRLDQEVGGMTVRGRLLRSHATTSALPISVQLDPTAAAPLAPGASAGRNVAAGADGAGTAGDDRTAAGMAPADEGATREPLTLVWRRFPTADPWQRVRLLPRADRLEAEIPAQPPAGKVEYFLEVHDRGRVHRVPADEALVARFKGEVPAAVLAVHVLAMFTGMLVSVRAGLEALVRGPALRRQAWATLGLLVVGGLILGPVVQKHAFGAYWTGWPLGEDLTDNKLLVAVLAWAVAVWRLRGYRPEPGGQAGSQAGALGGTGARTPATRGRNWALVAAVIVLLVYAVPHSLHGSTLDYATGAHIQR